MKILALEFSSDRRSVAVLDSAPPVCALAEKAVEGVRSTPALALIEQALRDAGLGREAIGCIAVGLGPGSYTGIRIAIALAQGWQFARDVKLVGVSSAECLARTLRLAGGRGRVTFAIDAQRNEFYVAEYELAEDSERGVVPLHIVPAEEVKQRIARGDLVAGPEVASRFGAGTSVFPAAAALATLAAARREFVPGEMLEPIYLRETAFVKAPPPRTL